MNDEGREDEEAQIVKDYDWERSEPMDLMSFFNFCQRRLLLFRCKYYLQFIINLN